MSAPRVLVAGMRYPPAIGGVEAYLAAIVDTGRRTGAYATTVVTTDLLENGGQRFERPPAPEPGVLRLRARPMYGRRTYPVARGMRRAIAQEAARADVLHAASLYYETFDQIIRCALRTGQPVVVNPHAYRRRFTWTPYIRWLGWAVRRADATLVTVSGFEEALLADLGVLTDATRVRRISPIVEDNPHRDLSRALGSSGRLELVFAGRLEEGKGALDLPGILDAVLARGIDARLTVLGDGRDRRLLEAEAERRPGTLVVRGRVTDDEKQRTLATSDVLVLPTRYEAFGIVLGEAMRSGAVPAAYPAGAVPEVLDHGRLGILAPASTPDALAGAIAEAVATGPALHERRSTAAEHAAALWGRERWDDAWAAVYQGR